MEENKSELIMESNIKEELIEKTVEETPEENLLERLGKLSDEDLERVCRKAIRIKRNKKMIRNTEDDLVKKGRNRNEICPFCEKKEKKCACVYDI